MGRVSVLSRQSQGPASRALAPRTRAAGSGSTSCATPSPTRLSRVYAHRAIRRHDGIAPAPRRAGRRLDRSQRLVLRIQRSRLQRLSPAIRWPPRCWRTACGWWAAASSCIGRAGSITCGVEEPSGFVDVGSGAAAHSQHARDAGRAVRGTGRGQRQLLAERGLRSRRDQQPDSPRCCRPASTTRLSNGRTGICSSLDSRAWQVSAEASGERDPDRYEEIAARRRRAGGRRRSRRA